MNITNTNSMNISKERLLQFIRLFEQKTGIKLSEEKALERAEILLRTISILYKPVNKFDYYKTEVDYSFFCTPQNS